MDARKLSVLSAIAASSCCVLPLVLLGLTLLGVGTVGLVGFSSTIGSLKGYLLPLAFVGLGLSFRQFLKEKRKCEGSSCRMVGEKLTRTMLTISTLMVLGFTGWSVYPYLLPAQALPRYEVSASASLATFEVNGMTCGGCEIAVDEAIEATGLVDSVRSSFIESRAYVWGANPKQSRDAILKAIASVGYKATPVLPSEVTK